MPFLWLPVSGQLRVPGRAERPCRVKAVAERNRGADQVNTRVWPHWELVNRLAARRFNREEVAEEAALYVLERLAEDDWLRLRKFQGKSSFASYLAAVAGRLLEDFSRRRYGRKRPPGWLEQLGGLWLLLYRLLCLERFGFGDAVEMAADRYRGRRVPEIEEAASLILGRITDCGAHQYQPSEYHQRFPENHQDHGSAAQSSRLEREQRQQLLEALGIELFGTGPGRERHQALEKILAQRLELSGKDRLLLRLCHQEGLGTAAAGRLLGLNRFQVHGRLRRLYARIREAFSAAGCEEELQVLLRD